MQRKIKFRLRSLDNDSVGFEKWYPGSWNETQYYWVAKPCWLYSKDDENWTPDPIGHKYKDQYTELEDKNGESIYEGDIVNWGDNYPSVIEWNNNERLEGHGWILHEYYIDQSDRYHTTSAYTNPIEVLGNIYENPELIIPYKKGNKK